MIQSRSWVSALLVCAVGAAVAVAQEGEPTGPFANLEWRSIGPINMSGRVADVEGIPGNPNVVYVGSASGGVWKTENGGLTFEPIFDDQPIASIGDLALAPSNPEVIYVGSGEANTRNSVSFGNGVYKSTDGGASWKHVGLTESRHISRVLVHPTDPDTVFVGALGHIYGPNEERGVFRSRDGGSTWERVLYVDDRHGVADLDMDPNNPNVLFAAMWHFERKPWTHTSGSEEGGVWRSTDGGDSWTKLVEGLPRLMGRIGVKVAPSNSKVVYVIAESDDGVLFRSDDRGDTFTQVSDDVRIVSRGFYYTDLRVDPVDEDRVYAIASRLFVSIDGGATFRRISRSTHVDYHSLWIDPEDPERIWQGQDGGVAVSYDRGATWEPIRNLPIGQFYQVFHDDRQPFYYLGGGLQDNGTWYGPSRTREPAGILQDDWRMMSFGDAYFVVPHPEFEDLFLSEYQAGGIVRTDMRTRQQVDVNPQPRRNDGGPVSELEYRFNWNAPIIASPHDPMTIYFAGNVVFKTTDFGDTWERISPDLTTNDPDKMGEAGGPVWKENTTAEYHCTIISLAESPVEPGLLWVGTDDGKLQLSRDGGSTWTDLTRYLRGVPEFSPISHVEPSRTDAGTAWVAFDRHMFDDLRPHVFRTTDYGATWTRVSGDLPAEGWVWVLRQDPRASDLLYAGTEIGLWATRDGGAHWERLHLSNLPTVAVHDLLIHPRANDLILGTHGRAIWVFDDATPIQEFGPAVAAKPVHLFPIRDALRFPSRFTRYGLGDKEHKAPNPPSGAIISYYLAEGLQPQEAEEKPEAEGPAGQAVSEPPLTIEILDTTGTVVRTLEDPGLEAGINRIAWNLAYDAPRPRTDEKLEASEFGDPPRGPMALPGTYTVRLSLDAITEEQSVEVGVDPLVPVSIEDLTAQFEVASELRDMISVLNDGLRGLDAWKSQLEPRAALLKLLQREQPEDLGALLAERGEALEAILSTLARAEGKPFWSQGPRLSERLADLFSNVDGGFQRPSAAQMQYLEELRSELATAVGDLNRLFSEDLPALNAALAAAELPELLVPDPIGDPPQPAD